MSTFRIVAAFALLSPVFALIAAVFLVIAIVAVPCALIVALAVWLDLVDLQTWRIVRKEWP